MAFDLDRFTRTRPRLFHLTACANVARITRLGRLVCATTIYREAGSPSRARVRRRSHDTVALGRDVIQIRDQAPLHEGNAGLAAGWTIEDLVKYLNDHVYFWPGTAAGPVESGLRHFQRYADEDCAVIELDTEAVFSMNGHPLFCKYNSGSPRCNNGDKSPRGPDTFQRHNLFRGTPSNVVEVTFKNEMMLPDGALTLRTVEDFI
jgi:hypothetical protein